MVFCGFLSVLWTFYWSFCKSSTLKTFRKLEAGHAMCRSDSPTGTRCPSLEVKSLNEITTTRYMPEDELDIVSH